MKRGSQPDLPPCDSAPDASSTRSPNPSAPLIERARYVAFQFSQKLPNFICEEYMARIASEARTKRSWTLFRLKSFTTMNRKVIAM